MTPDQIEQLGRDLASRDAQRLVAQPQKKLEAWIAANLAGAAAARADVWSPSERAHLARTYRRRLHVLLLQHEAAAAARERTCGCGRALTYLAGAGVHAALCPVCDAHALAELAELEP